MLGGTVLKVFYNKITLLIFFIFLFTVGFCLFSEKTVLHDYSYNDCTSLPTEEVVDIAKDIRGVKIINVDGDNTYIQFKFSADEYELRGLPCESVTSSDRFWQFAVVIFVYSFALTLLCSFYSLVFYG